MTLCPVGIRNSAKSTHVENFLMNPRTREKCCKHTSASPVAEFIISLYKFILKENFLGREEFSNLKFVNFRHPAKLHDFYKLEFDYARGDFLRCVLCNF